MKFLILKSLILVSNLFLFTTYCFSQGTVGGMGASLSFDTEKKCTYIKEVYANGSAEKLNLISGDLIIGVDNLSTVGLDVFNVRRLILGEVGSTCHVKIKRNETIYSISFNRTEINLSECIVVKSNFPTPFFTDYIWSGNCINNFANGYGVIQLFNYGILEDYYKGFVSAGKLNGKGTFYNSDGYKIMEGTFKNNQLNGYGKKYDSKGNLKFEGYFINGEMKILSQEDVQDLGRKLVDEIFDGGTNINAKIIEWKRFTESRQLGDKNILIKIKITFNGNYDKSNYYEFTLKMWESFSGFDFTFIDANDIARQYISTKTGVKLGYKLGVLFKELEESNK